MANPNFIGIYSTFNIWRAANEDICLDDDLVAIESDIADLQSGKADTDHTHSGYAASNHSHNGYAPTGHSHSEYADVIHIHEQTDISGLADSLAGKAEANHGHSDLAAASHTHAQADVTGLATALAGKSDASHTHDGFAASTHTHGQADVTGLTSALGAKADLVDGKVPASQLPSFVDDVLEGTLATFPAAGESGKIYVDTTTNKSYRWSGSQYAEIAGGVALGETSATAFRGDHGKTAYDHSQNNDIHVTAAEKSAWNGKAAGTHTHAQSEITGLETALSEKAATSHSHDNATTSAAGYMSASDKSKLDGIATGANKYTHPAYTAKGSGLYKVTVDATGHISAATAVTKSDITALGIPAEDTNTTYSAASTSAAGLMSADDKVKLNGIATGANKTTVDSALSSTSTNPVQNKVINTALAGKAASSHTHDYLPLTGGTINGDTNVAGILRVNSQQSFYFQTSTMSQTVGTNNATGGTTICCGASADVGVNGANMKTPNILPRGNNAFTLGNTSYRWKGIYSTAAVNVSSDERMKRDIAAMDGENLARFIEALNVVSYNYKDDEADRKARIGLIAQDVQKADAEISKFFVNEDETGMLNLTPADLVFPLIAAVQQLSKRVAELEAKL